MTQRSRAWHWLVEVMLGPSPAAEDEAPSWLDVIQQANIHQVTSGLWQRIRDRAALVGTMGDDERGYLESFHALTQSRNIAICEQTLGIAETLRRSAIPTIALKGAAYLLEDLPDASSRHTTDIDVLVPASEADRAREKLLAEGYRDADVTLADGRGHHHLIPMIRPGQPAAVEIHTDVVPSGLTPALDGDGVRARARRLVRAGVEIGIPHPTDHAAISFLHAELVDLGTQLWRIPLRQFCDLAMLDGVYGTDVDWAEIADRSRKVGGIRDLRRYVYVFEQLSGKRLLPVLGYSLSDRLSYKLALASIDRPGIRQWRLRANRLSRRKLRRQHGDLSPVGMGLVRIRELGRMLRDAVSPRRD